MKKENHTAIIHEVFRLMPNEEVVTSFVKLLESIENEFPQQLDIQVPGKGTHKYFTLTAFGTKQKDTLIIAGARHGHPINGTISCIRVRTDNPVLSNIPREFKFEFKQPRKEAWTCVEIHALTLPFIENLIECEIQNHFQLVRQTIGLIKSYEKAKENSFIPEIRISENLTLSSKIIGIEPIIESILNSPSQKPQALPLRSNSQIPQHWGDIESRETNRSVYSTAKNLFIRQHLELLDSKSGLYFFLRITKNIPEQYYYIGLAENISRRLIEHVTRRDFVYYSIAYPSNATQYLQEVIAFYASQPRYSGYKATYELEIKSLEKVCFTHMAWISAPELNGNLLETLETYFILDNDPPVNIAKKDMPRPSSFLKEYKQAKDYLKNLIDGCA